MSVSFANRRMLSLRQNKRSVFSRTCAGKRHLKRSARDDEREVHGEKTTERASCEVRVLSSRQKKRGFICHQFHISQTTTTVRLRK